ncbi:MAG TPA: hypothetical protein VNO52_14080, partial [Methylomirabilota bacterium]|nr:hypothetical protein [Methylomirabilota bacterium]
MTRIAPPAARPLSRGPASWVAALLLGSVPAPAVELDDGRITDSIPGITYTNERRRDVPWSIHVIKIDRSRTDLEVHSMLARETVLGLATLVQQIKSLPNSLGRPVAALNGDFYEVEQGSPYVGDPRGLQILRGELVSAPTDQATFWLDAHGTPWMTNVLSRL